MMLPGNPSRLPRERKFYLAMAASLLLVVVVGFCKTFFLRPFFPEVEAPREPLIFVHGAVFVAWCVLLVVQALLISSRRIAVHQTLGRIGALIAALMVVMGIVASFIGAMRPGGYFGLSPPLVVLGLELAYLPMFAALVGVAIAFRRTPQVHKRLLLIATISIMPVALARFPVIYTWSKPTQFWLADLWIVALLAWDLVSRGRIHAATLVGGASLILWQRLTLHFIGNEHWVACARWLTGLVRQVGSP